MAENEDQDPAPQEATTAVVDATRIVETALGILLDRVDALGEKLEARRLEEISQRALEASVVARQLQDIADKIDAIEKGFWTR